MALNLKILQTKKLLLIKTNQQAHLRICKCRLQGKTRAQGVIHEVILL